MTLRKVKTGDPLVIPAETFNTFIDAALDFRKRQTAVTRRSQAGHRQSGIILVKNASGADRQRFHILGLADPLITPDYNEDEFRNRVALTGELPAEADHVGRFVVLLEPLKADGVGLAFAQGLCPVKVTVESEEHGYADVNDGEAATLKSGPSGAAQILWKEAGTGEKWAVVRLGVPAGLPPIYKATADQSGNTVLAKLLLADGSLATGNAEELDVYSDAWKVRTDDLLVLTQDADGLPVAMPIQGCDNAFTVPAGSGSAAETTTWDINSQPSGYGGVLVEQWFRLYWSGTSGDPVYQFTREARYDSKGALLYVGPEVRSVAFGTDTCE